MRVDTHVRYKDINLWSYKGVIIDIGSQPFGGDCRVKWQSTPYRNEIVSIELLSNLEETHDD